MIDLCATSWSDVSIGSLFLTLPPTDVKQIQWEIERDKWLHNRDVKSIIKKKKQFRHRGLKNKYKSKKSRQWMGCLDVDILKIIILK